MLDDFQRADGTLGANWIDTTDSGLNAGGTKLALQDGGVYCAATSSAWISAVWNGSATASDQFSEILIRTYFNAATNPGVGVIVRRNTNGSANYYQAFYFAGNIYLYAHTGGGFTLITSVAHTVAPGDVLRLVASGSNPVRLQVFSNGSSVIDTNDATFLITGGQPGLAVFEGGLSAVESWAGDSGNAAVSHPTPPAPWRPTTTMTVRNKRVVSGVTYLDFVSIYNYDSGAVLTTTMRYLLPDSPSAGVPRRFLYILPVEAAVPGVTFGDGLDVIRAANLHNLYNLVLIAPGFITDNIWCCDHDSDASRRHESYLVNELLPWTKTQFDYTNEEQWIIGFSRTGYGGADLILRNPTVFNKAAVWDFPADFVYTDFAAYSFPHGTQANFDNNYHLTQSFINGKAGSFTGTRRLWVSGDEVSWTAQVQNFAARLDSAAVLYKYSDEGVRAHSWSSGWVPTALAGLSGLGVKHHWMTMGVGG